MRADGGALLALARLVLARRLKLRLHLALGGLEESLGVASGVLAPFLLKRIVDQLGRGPGSGLLLTILAFVATWSAGSLFGGLKVIHSSRIVERLTTAISADVLQCQLPRLAEGAAESQPVFSALERLPQSLQVLVDGLLWRLGPLLVQVAASLLAIAWLTPRFAGMLAVALLVYAVLAERGTRSCQRKADEAHGATEQIARNLGDVLVNARRVIFNGALSHELDRFMALSGRRQEAAAAFAQGFAAFMTLQFLALLIGVGLVLAAAGREVAEGRLTVGVFVLLQAFAFRLSGPLAGAGFLAKETVAALANLRALFGYTHAPPPLSPVTHAAGGPASGVAVSDIAFRYPSAPTGLAAISTTLERGAYVALVGPNGAGKSTLAKILGGVLPPDSGDVSVEGASLYATSPERRIDQALYIPQTVSLLDRTLRENGLYPPSRLSEERLLHHLDAFRFFEDGRPATMDASVGEGGHCLSGGQVQKLELARLTGVAAPFLVIDELTASLDQASARRAVATLRRASPATTLLIVTHDRAIAEAADKVLFLTEGGLHGEGPHRALMTQSARYRDFWTCASWA